MTNRQSEGQVMRVRRCSLDLAPNHSDTACGT
jgi:hypothetical protein